MPLSWKQVEDLATAYLKNAGGIVHKAKPSMRRITDGHEEEVEATHDLWTCIDVASINAEGTLLVQVKSGGESVSEAQTKIVAYADWPVWANWLSVEVWKWKGDWFKVWVLTLDDRDQYVWEEGPPVPVPNHRALLNRYDTSLDIEGATT